MKRLTTIGLMAAVMAGALAAGCRSKKPVVKDVPETDTPPAKVETKPVAKADTTQTPASPSLSVSGDLAALCQLKIDAAKASPKFDYDKAELLPEDRAILEQIATCVTTGPGKGKALSLTGRADPRGTEEYNLGLGSRRSASVSGYLEKLGVGTPQLAVTTRGALEATGTDEAGWQKDRRVDVLLKTE